jgi:hypothetical protein
MALLLLHDIIAGTGRIENGADPTENTASWLFTGRCLAMAVTSGSTILTLNKPVTMF